MMTKVYFQLMINKKEVDIRKECIIRVLNFIILKILYIRIQTRILNKRTVIF